MRRIKMFRGGNLVVIALGFGFLCAGLSAADEFDDPVTPGPDSKRCPAIEGITDTCVCHDGKGKIDLTALSNNDNTPRFTGFADATGYTYNYNPCTPYKSSLCHENKDHEVFSCQVSSDGKTGYLVADGGTEEMWIAEDETVFLFYTGSDNRVTKVNLHCDQEAKNASISTSGDTIVELTYVFDITSCHVCPGGCGRAVEPKSAFDVVGIIGIVIILVVIGAILTYFIAGAIIMKVHYKAEGSDIIPNKNLWFQLPSLVKDGCLCTFLPPVRFIKAKVKGEEYQKINS